ncbi:MAG TPA: CoF synthetase [Clostridiales bacterium]|nr:CoF synthetase [Clostridiales bacterium]
MKRSNLDLWVRKTEGLPVLDRAAVEALQLAGLNALLERERARGGFYSGLPGGLASLSDLASLPFTTQADLAARGSGMVLVSQSEILRVLTETSGTTGPAKRVFYTPGDCENTVSFFAAGLSELVFPGSRTMVCMPFSGPYGLGELISAAVESLGASPIKTGVGKSCGELSDILRRERPDTYVGMPAPLLAMLKVCGRGTLRRALVSGDACSLSVEQGVEARLGTRLFPHYGSRETVFGGAVTCPAHEGMHLRENHMIAEIVDEEGNVLPRGEYGELVITTIGMAAMPLIRYRTGDYTRIFKEPCPCKSPLLRIDRVTRKGPGAEILKLDEALFGLDGLVDFHAKYAGSAVEILALTLAEPAQAEIEAAARRALPEVEVRVTARKCTRSDRPLYPGKRSLENAEAL